MKNIIQDQMDRRNKYKIDHRARSEAENRKADADALNVAKPSVDKSKSTVELNTPSKEMKNSKFEAKGDKGSKEPKKGRWEESQPKEKSDEVETGTKKFTGRCRLFIGNVPPETNERDFASWFKPYGECSEVFLNAHRGFGFIRMDTRENAEKAKKGVDGLIRRGRTLRARFAAHVAAIRVKHLHLFVSNELLADAFSNFGEIERAVVIIDDKGKSTGEGIVEFTRKPGAIQALKRVNEGVFLLGSSPRPVMCEMLEQKDDEDGMPEVFMSKSQDFQKEREEVPRFAPPGSFEYNFAQKWKALYSNYEQQKKTVEDQFQDAVSKLELDETNARMEHQTAMMREDLLRRQEELRQMEERHKMEMQRRIETRPNQQPPLHGFDRTTDEQRRMMDMQRGMDLRHHQEEAKRKMDEERRREEEARMFMQQEMAMRQMQQEEMGRRPPPRGEGAAPMQPPPAPPLNGGQGGEQPQRGEGRNEVPSLLNIGTRMGQGDMGRPNEMGGPNRGGNMQGGMHPQGMQQQNMQQPPQQQNMQGGGMRGRKGDSDYRQSRFDQPRSRFDQPPQQNMAGNPQMNMGNPNFGNQQMPMGNPQMENQMNPMTQQMGMAHMGGQQMGMGGQPMGGQPMGGQQMGGQPMGGQPMGGQPMGNMGNQMMPMGGQMQGQNMGMMNQGIQGGNQANMGGQANQPQGKHERPREGRGGNREGNRDEFYDAKRARRY